MISFTVRMRFEEKDRPVLEEILHNLAAASRQEAGCTYFLPHFVEGEPATVLIYEQYRDEAALEHHRGSAHFKQYASGGLYQLMKERSLEMLHSIE